MPGAGKVKLTHTFHNTVHGVMFWIILVLLFAMGYYDSYVSRLLSDRDTLSREIGVNAATMATLSDRLIYLEQAATIETLASWYGLEHNGRMTASGTVFDSREFTAASPWLPFGSRWRVRRVDTGAEITVEITDRGPHMRLGRGLDLSHAAARKLGIIRDGVVRVSISPAI
jgi:rare lipoprotein A